MIGQKVILELCNIFRTSISNSYTAKPALKGIPRGHKRVFVSLFLHSLATSVMFYLFFQLFISITSSCKSVSYTLFVLFDVSLSRYSLARSELNFILSATGCSFSENFQ